MLYLHSSAGAYGADRQLALIATGLDPARYRPVVLLAQDGPLVGELREAGVETEVVPLAVLRRSEISAGGLARLGLRIATTTGLARRPDVALVHSNTSVTLSGALAARRAGVPHVWHVREIYTERTWPAYRRVLGTADSLPCVSAAVRAQFPERSPAVVVGDGVAILGPPANPQPPVAGGPLVCVVLGRISPWKGQAVLLRAIAQVPGTIAVVAGDAWSGQEHREVELRDLASGLGIADRVRFVGFVADPRSLYAASSVVVVPSTRPDPLPNAALEAAAAGCCVVASAHGGLTEIVRDGETGLLVAPDDPAALAGALRRLAGDPGLRSRLARAAADDVGRRYAPGLLLERVQDLYDRLLTARS
ncbi:MAG TPA: glycosyltransferase family 4 protein [Solirubrobacteraceae bacterium]|nr:glycosyltransferase family 4 protein [Solirubrobacteraceae bacterium]